jgi:hypothetical protein
VTNAVTASTLTGTLSTPAQPNITSIGALSSLNISGTQESTSASTGVIVASGGIAAKNIYLTSSDQPQVQIANSASTGTATIKLNTNTRGFEIGLRGSTAAQPNTFYLYDTTASAYRALIDTNGNVGIGTTPGATLKLNVGGNFKASGSASVDGVLYIGCGIVRIYYGQYTMSGSSSQSKTATVNHNLDITDTARCCITMTIYDTGGYQDQFALKIISKEANHFSFKAWRIEGPGWNAEFKVDWQMTILTSTNYITSSY